MSRGTHHRVHAQDRAQRTRHRVAQEAARLMTEHGIRDYRLAKTKAASRLGVDDEQSLPRNREVEQALREHQRLFHADTQSAALRTLREAACEALSFFAPFHARLVGPVLAGTADHHSAVCLQLFCDAPETLHSFLHDQGIPFSESTRRLRMTRNDYQDMPVLEIMADGVAFDLTVLPTLAQRQAPLDKIDEKPMPRASLTAVRALLEQPDSSGSLL